MLDQKWNMVAPCGLYCGECTGYLSGKCGGCRSNEGISKEYNQDCKIYNCLNNKNLKICLECEGFPCKFFDFFKAETLQGSSWFLDIWSNMKHIKEADLTNFLAEKENWLNRRKECAEKRGVKYCDECERWPCELLKRPVLVPADLKEFKAFMKKIENNKC